MHGSRTPWRTGSHHHEGFWKGVFMNIYMYTGCTTHIHVSILMYVHTCLYGHLHKLLMVPKLESWHVVGTSTVSICTNMWDKVSGNWRSKKWKVDGLSILQFKWQGQEMEVSIFNMSQIEMFPVTAWQLQKEHRQDLDLSKVMAITSIKSGQDLAQQIYNHTNTKRENGRNTLQVKDKGSIQKWKPQREVMCGSLPYWDTVRSCAGAIFYGSNNHTHG